MPASPGSSPTAVAHRDRRSVAYAALLLAAVAVAVALRVWVLSSSLGRADGDEAVVGLMAREFRQGTFAVFFWGQNHGGTIEPVLASGLFTLFGSSTLALKFVPIALSAVASLLVWRIARRVIGAERAVFAGVLFTLYPSAFVWWSTKERGFYWAGLVCALLVMLQALRVSERSADGERRTLRFDLAVIGFLVGVAWWTTPQSLYLVGPVLVWLGVQQRHRFREAWPALPAALVGAAPWLVWNAAHGFSSLYEAEPAVASTYAERFRGFFARLLPTVLGLRVPFSGDWLLGPVGVVAYVTVMAAFAVWFARVLRRRDRRTRLGPVLVAAVAYPFVFAAPGASIFTGEPRYGLMLAPTIVVVIACVASRRAAQVFAVFVAIVVGVATIGSMSGYADDHPLSVDLAPVDLAPLEDALTDAGVTRVYADYWIAYPLTFTTDERYVATAVDFVRAARVHELVDATAPSTYVVFRGAGRDGALSAALDARGIGYDRVEQGAFAVYLLDRHVKPGALEEVWRGSSL